MIYEDLKKNNSHYDLCLNSSYTLSIVENINDNSFNKSHVMKRNNLNLDSFPSDENESLAHSIIDFDNYSQIKDEHKENAQPKEELISIQIFKCGVCHSNDLDKNQIYKFDCCNHSFCLSCLEEYFELLINENKISKIKCIIEHCDSKISDDDLIKILSIKSAEKYLKFSKRIDIINNPNKINCPFPDCEEYAILNTVDRYKLNAQENPSGTSMTHTKYMSSINLQPTETELNEIIISNDVLIRSKYFYVSCEAGHKFCRECKSLEWHEGKTCTQSNTELYNYLQCSAQDHKNCPACGIWIEKIIGCNHMVCTTCNNQWCWLCEEEFKPDHYINKNSKCFGRMYEGSRLVSNLIFDNNEWFNEQPQARRHSNAINLNDNNIPRTESVVNKIESQFFLIYRNYFSIELKHFSNCFYRFLYTIGVLILLVISNYGILKGASNYLEQKFSFYNDPRHSGKKMKYNIINILVSLSVWIYTFTLGFLATLIIYIPPLYKYVGGTLFK